MTSVAHADTESDTNALESLDWAIPCEYHMHRDVGIGPATLIVVCLPRPCGCERPPVRFFCDECWAVRATAGSVFCHGCGAIYGPYELVLRVERI